MCDSLDPPSRSGRLRARPCLGPPSAAWAVALVSACAGSSPLRPENSGPRVAVLPPAVWSSQLPADRAASVVADVNAALRRATGWALVPVPEAAAAGPALTDAAMVDPRRCYSGRCLRSLADELEADAVLRVALDTTEGHCAVFADLVALSPDAPYGQGAAGFDCEAAGAGALAATAVVLRLLGRPEASRRPSFGSGLAPRPPSSLLGPDVGPLEWPAAVARAGLGPGEGDGGALRKLLDDRFLQGARARRNSAFYEDFLRVVRYASEERGVAQSAEAAWRFLVAWPDRAGSPCAERVAAFRRALLIDPEAEPPDVEEALEAACAGKAAGGCVALADLLDDGAEHWRDKDRAAALRREVVEAAAGPAWLAEASAAGRPPWNRPGQQQAVERACQDCEPSACYILAEHAKRTGRRGEGERAAFPLLRRACACGHARACADLEDDPEDLPEPGSQEDRELTSLLALACAAGSAAACERIGSEFVAEDAAASRSLGLDLLRSTCAGPGGYGCAHLVKLEVSQEGARCDGPSSRGRLLRACAAGREAACRLFSACVYEHGAAADR